MFAENSFGYALRVINENLEVHITKIKSEYAWKLMLTRFTCFGALSKQLGCGIENHTRMYVQGEMSDATILASLQYNGLIFVTNKAVLKSKS